METLREIASESAKKQHHQNESVLSNCQILETMEFSESTHGL